MDLKAFIRDIPDFPSQGVLFKDITPLLKSPEALRTTTERLLQMVNGEVDIVVGMESRGFFFAPILASTLNAGFVPVRKSGKLPGKVVEETYALEYGQDTLEILEDSISKGDRVLIHDDVLATGGTAVATCALVERLGGKVVQCNFLIELEFLKGRGQLNGFDVKSLMRY
ncbi:adenine phosphoribosyltransferase [Ulvibacterium marinum]|uniref:Adenine phosphoribosyltransferase n=1 Tax=Ulvibacterium marinum TaxID=2419782 RepID=A0A3B0C575_9FLAO|nr:adenine phosphoribosyltransferase [Ulvibacterium marinum]RKN79921.1 adenine phosphoribosyltransferase [Ulvibacterium marinum]